MKFIIYTDGACHVHTDQIGGWGCYITYKDKEAKISGAEEKTTNNRMELMAPIKALEGIKKPHLVHIVSDSQYVINGITKWIFKWVGNNSFKKNPDLWRRLYELTYKKGHTVTWEWVKGHNGHPGNEIADRLASEAIYSYRKRLIQGTS